MVAHLGEEARAWVELQLDRGVVEQAWTRTPGELERNRDQGGQRRRKPARARTGEAARGDGAGELSAAMDEGRAALASYDYEGARAAFERAHGLAPEGAAPLAALLGLLVNRLGLDREALDAAEGAVGAIGHSPAVRAILGLAAARLGASTRPAPGAMDSTVNARAARLRSHKGSSAVWPGRDRRCAPAAARERARSVRGLFRRWSC